jgi:hypothetical protein
MRTAQRAEIVNTVEFGWAWGVILRSLKTQSVIFGAGMT